jgi:hypothetical protein
VIYFVDRKYEVNSWIDIGIKVDMLPVIQTNFVFSAEIFNSQKKKSQKLNVFFLDQNRRNFTPQKLPVIGI